jgi:adenylate kinase
LHSRRICGVCGTNADPAVPDATRCGVCGGELVHRTDDGESVVRNRLQVYDQQTRPLVAYYRSSPTFFEIDADQMPDLVAGAMQAAISQTLGATEESRS